MQPDTLAVIAILALLVVAAVILGLLLYSRRGYASRERNARDRKD